MVSHHNIIANVLQLCTFESVSRRALGIDTQVVLGVLPFSHIYGLTLLALAAPYRGDGLVVLPRFELASYLDAVQRFRIEQLSVVPPILIQMMGNQDVCRKYDLSSVRLVYSGAAPLGSEVMDDLQRVYPEWHLSQGYGNSSFSTPSASNDSHGHRHDGGISPHRQHRRDRSARRLVRQSSPRSESQDHRPRRQRGYGA
jgi:acyl-CoA synthetase (AMP-forming)/AMP-acid ligase II